MHCLRDGRSHERKNFLVSRPTVANYDQVLRVAGGVAGRLHATLSLGGLSSVVVSGNGISVTSFGVSQIPQGTEPCGIDASIPSRAQRRRLRR